MWIIFADEVKHYFKNSKELIQIYSLFVSIVLLYFFSHAAGELKNQSLVSSMLWTALTMAVALGGGQLFSRDHDSGRVGYYSLMLGHLGGYIMAKWMAYYLFTSIPLLFILPVVALLVDIPVGEWLFYGVGLASGAMALSLLSSFVAAVMVGVEKVAALVAIVMLPLSVPLIIFGSAYLQAPQSLLQPQLFMLWGFSLIMLPVLCLVGAHVMRQAN